MKGLEKFEPSSYYHIINHAVGSVNLFRCDDNYRYFLKKNRLIFIHPPLRGYSKNGDYLKLGEIK